MSVRCRCFTGSPDRHADHERLNAAATSSARRWTRRGFIAAAAAVAGAVRDASAAGPAWSYPLGLPGRVLGDGCWIRDGYACENTWYNPGSWHTGEDWYVLDAETAGTDVFAVSAGEIVYADSDYPGRVVIVRHDSGLYSMYGHLAYDLPVAVGQTVARGDRIGAVLARNDGVPSHLHFEIRTFLTTDAVNGANPRYGFACGVNCPPGPGYWPMNAPDHPSEIGWRNPVHVINRRAWPRGTSPGEALVAASPPTSSVDVRASPSADARRRDTLSLTPGTRYPLLSVHIGAENSAATSADGYDLWYELQLSEKTRGWIQAIVPSDFDRGSDGRPSSLRFNFVPVV